LPIIQLRARDTLIVVLGLKSLSRIRLPPERGSLLLPSPFAAKRFHAIRTRFRFVSLKSFVLSFVSSSVERSRSSVSVIGVTGPEVQQKDNNKRFAINNKNNNNCHT
jgi:hypothetical protein